MSGITLTDLRKEFDDVTAVNGIDLDVDDGEFLVLVGPSGCGKSTTLRCIAGLETATDGTIRVGDADVTEAPPKDRDVAMVFQNYALYPHMTAAENMKFGMTSSGDYTAAEIEAKIEEAGEILDIADLLDRRPGELSGGEQQRVAIGRAIVREPEVFLLDEPLSNLDAKLRVEMRAELLELHRELETTSVYVTHDQTEAMTLGDRVAVMNDGRIEQVAEPQTLYDVPETQFVAEFVGNPAMNVVPASVERSGDEYVAVHEGFEARLPRKPTLERAVDREVTFGVRPEHVSPVEVAGDAEASVGRFTGEVLTREPLGESLLVRVRVGRDQLQVKTEPRIDLEPGESIELRFDPDRLHLFDAASGEAIYHSAPAADASTDDEPSEDAQTDDAPTDDASSDNTTAVSASE